MKIYIASSWSNEYHNRIVGTLKYNGYDVYDYRKVNGSFQWDEIDEYWPKWTLSDYRYQLKTNPRVKLAFKNNMDALNYCNVCILIEPSGKSSHLELGYVTGKGKVSIILLSKDSFQPDLMYKMADYICMDINEILEILNELNEAHYNE